MTISATLLPPPSPLAFSFLPFSPSFPLPPRFSFPLAIHLYRLFFPFFSSLVESLSLLAPPFKTLSLTLPFAVDYEEAKVKFVKKTRTLKITIPRVWGMPHSCVLHYMTYCVICSSRRCAPLELLSRECNGCRIPVCSITLHDLLCHLFVKKTCTIRITIARVWAMTHSGHDIPQTEEIRFKIIMTAEFSTSFHGSPVTLKHVFTGVPILSNSFSRKWTGVPSLKGVAGKTGQSRHPRCKLLLLLETVV